MIGANSVSELLGSRGLGDQSKFWFRAGSELGFPPCLVQQIKESPQPSEAERLCSCLVLLGALLGYL